MVSRAKFICKGYFRKIGFTIQCKMMLLSALNNPLAPVCMPQCQQWRKYSEKQEIQTLSSCDEWPDCCQPQRFTFCRYAVNLLCRSVHNWNMAIQWDNLHGNIWHLSQTNTVLWYIKRKKYQSRERKVKRWWKTICYKKYNHHMKSSYEIAIWYAGISSKWNKQRNAVWFDWVRTLFFSNKDHCMNIKLVLLPKSKWSWKSWYKVGCTRWIFRFTSWP